ncbi:MAG: DUF4838 domain-containing protein [Candidatus Omnitrophica bacterium]|nr:DUF4838 domain-containing protein [Candidatus Omnitrophota bacterium]
MRRKILMTLLIFGLSFSFGHCASLTPPALLPGSSWNITDVNGAAVTTLTDGDTLTSTVLTRNGSTPAGLLIDLGQTTLLHRVYVTGPTHKLWVWPNSYDNRNKPPLGIINVYVGDTLSTLKLVTFTLVPYDAGDPVDMEFDLRFHLTSGKYVKVEFQTVFDLSAATYGAWPKATTPSDVGWKVSEVELYGFTGAAASTKQDAVVMPASKASALTLAGDELSYYLSEMTGKPVPIITEADAALYPGTLYRIVDLGSLAPNYETMMTNIQNGSLPEGINVARNGRYVDFKAWPYRNVLRSVWTFLRNDGVHWLYPDGHGETIPSVGSVDLSSLPMTKDAASDRIYANFDVTYFPWPVYYYGWTKQSYWQNYLYPWRNGFTTGWSTPDFLVASEVPLKKITATTIADEYKEGFAGYPHNFSNVVPQRILLLNPDWWGWLDYKALDKTLMTNATANGAAILTAMKNAGMSNDVTPAGGASSTQFRLSSDILAVEAWVNTTYPADASVVNAVLELSRGGERVDPRTSDAPALCLSNDSMIAWVANKMLAWEAYAPMESTTKLATAPRLSQLNKYYNLLPNDASHFCQCSLCKMHYLPIVPDPVPWVRMYSNSMSGPYYYFVNEIAKQVKAQNPVIKIWSLAYADVFLPSPTIPVMSDNIMTEVCLFGDPNLPPDSSLNVNGMKQAYLDWKARGVSLDTYEYTLLQEKNPMVPVAGVTGMAAWAKFQNGIGALSGGTQASDWNHPYTPWNFYAWPQLRIDPAKPAAVILDEFFNGYFGEAAAPMLAYYQTLENYQVTNDAGMHAGGYVYGITPGSFPIGILAKMESFLESAENLAQSWMVKERVARMRESFNWVLAQKGLTVSSLSDLSGYPVVGQNDQAFHLDLNKGSIYLGGYGAFGSSWNNIKPLWCFFAQGTIYQPLNFNRGGAYRIDLSAAAMPSAGINPVMNVYVGTKHLGSVEVVSAVPNSYGKNGTYNTYSFMVNIPDGYGVQDLLVSYANAAVGGARGLFIKDIAVTRIGEPYIPGDVSGNNQVTMYDAAMALKGSVISNTLSSEQTLRGEMDQNGKLTADDAVAIAKKALGIK